MPSEANHDSIKLNHEDLTYTEKSRRDDVFGNIAGVDRSEMYGNNVDVDLTDGDEQVRLQESNIYSQISGGIGETFYLQ